MIGPKMTDVLAAFFAPELRAWHGQQPLWKVFWVYGVAASGVLIAVYALGFYLEQAALRQILVICFAPYTAWIVISVWRCADNSEERYWGMLARFLTVAWACNAILILLFVQFNLIVRYYLHH